jgi:hypothetical protein
VVSLIEVLDADTRLLATRDALAQARADPPVPPLLHSARWAVAGVLIDRMAQK